VVRDSARRSRPPARGWVAVPGAAAGLRGGSLLLQLAPYDWPGLGSDSVRGGFLLDDLS
jgi:hypothetical protein